MRTPDCEKRLQGISSAHQLPSKAPSLELEPRTGEDSCGDGQQPGRGLRARELDSVHQVDEGEEEDEDAHGRVHDGPQYAALIGALERLPLGVALTQLAVLEVPAGL